jgi:glutathione synthase
VLKPATRCCLLPPPLPCFTPQVELNTIASSFACLSSITSQLHHYTLQRLAAAAGSSSSDAAAALQLLSACRLPANDAMQGICRALAAAVVAAGGEGAVMVMVVQPGERNAYDQQVRMSLIAV